MEKLFEKFNFIESASDIQSTEYNFLAILQKQFDLYKKAKLCDSTTTWADKINIDIIIKMQVKINICRNKIQKDNSKTTEAQVHKKEILKIISIYDFFEQFKTRFLQNYDCIDFKEVNKIISNANKIIGEREKKKRHIEKEEKRQNQQNKLEKI